MRYLILISALAAQAYGAPSGAILSPSGLQPTIQLIPSIPTISPGDVEAAAIDAQVKAEDTAQAALDQSRLIAEQAIEANKDKLKEHIDLANERSLEAFWSVEDQKWQLFDASNTAEAKLHGAIASNAENFAKAALATPLIGYSIYNQPLGIIAPQTQSIVTQSLSQTHPLQPLGSVAQPALKLAEIPAKPIEGNLELRPQLLIPFGSGFVAASPVIPELRLVSKC